YMTVADAEALGWDRAGGGEEAATTSQVMLSLEDSVAGAQLRTLVDEVGAIDGLQAEALGGGAPERSVYAQMVDLVMW
ncbi:hypothetical protein, partial [Acinetobacter baumannii]